MKIECKICKRNLTNQAIKLLENQINKIVCNYCEFDKWMNKLIKKNGVTKY